MKKIILTIATFLFLISCESKKYEINYTQLAEEIYKNYNVYTEKSDIYDNYQFVLTYFSNVENIEKIENEELRSFIKIYLKVAKKHNQNNIN